MHDTVFMIKFIFSYHSYIMLSIYLMKGIVDIEYIVYIDSWIQYEQLLWELY